MKRTLVNRTQQAVFFQGVKRRPGVPFSVDIEDIGKLAKIFVDVVEWVKQRKERRQENPRSGWLTVEEATAFLELLDDAHLEDLCRNVSPPVETGKVRPVLIRRLARALFMDDRILDPEKFFWLGRWRKRGEDFEGVPE